MPDSPGGQLADVAAPATGLDPIAQFEERRREGGDIRDAIRELATLSHLIPGVVPDRRELTGLMAEISPSLIEWGKRASGAEIAGLLGDLRVLQFRETLAIQPLSERLCEIGTSSECVAGFRAIAALRQRNTSLPGVMRRLVLNGVGECTDEELSHIARGWSRLELNDTTVPLAIGREVARRTAISDGEVIARLVESLWDRHALEIEVQEHLFERAQRGIGDLSKDALLSLARGLSKIRDDRRGILGENLFCAVYETIAEKGFSLDIREVDFLVSHLVTLRRAPANALRHLISQATERSESGQSREFVGLLLSFAKLGIKDSQMVDLLATRLLDAEDLSTRDRIGGAWALEAFGHPSARKLFDPVLGATGGAEALPRGYPQMMGHLCLLYGENLPDAYVEQVNAQASNNYRRSNRTSSFQMGVEFQLQALGAQFKTGVRVAGTEVDIVVTLPGGKRVALECDGDMYHSTEAGPLGRDVMKNRMLARKFEAVVRLRSSEENLHAGILAELAEGRFPSRGEPGYAPLTIEEYVVPQTLV